MKPKEIDAFDRAIIKALAQNGRLTQLHLADFVPLSPTAIARRIRALEEAGIISGYSARINRHALGYDMTAFVRIGLKNQSEELLTAFEQAVAAIPSIVNCYLVSGEDDYLLTVVARDLADYEQLHKQQLSRLPGLAKLNSNFALRGVLDNPFAALERA